MMLESPNPPRSRDQMLTNAVSYDGQAGAAGITLEDASPATEENVMASLYSELKKKGVPSYAFPRLVRLTDK